MSDEVLSQAEVESLLSAMDVSGPKAAVANGGSSGGSSQASNKPREKVMLYDFKRPERVGKEQMRGLQSLHEGFGRNFGAAMSALLRTMVDVKLTSVDQLTYSEFVFSLESPTCFNILRAEPLEGNLILDINPSILYPIIDRLLGGGKDGSPGHRRPLTEIETRLMSRITSLFLREMTHSWEAVMPLKLSVERVESNPQLVQIVPPNEVIILISFELTLGDLRGMMNLCIPFNSIERFASKLTANNWVAFSKAGSTAETQKQLGQHLEHAVVELVVTLADTKISTSDLLGLRVGDVITTEKDMRTALEVAVQGHPKFRASPGAFKGRKAIRIED